MMNRRLREVVLMVFLRAFFVLSSLGWRSAYLIKIIVSSLVFWPGKAKVMARLLIEVFSLFVLLSFLVQLYNPEISRQ
jgi:hypothetical protein